MLAPPPLVGAEGARSALNAYTRRAVDDGVTLVCASAARCAASVGSSTFVKGQASFVGSHYGLARQGRSLRILVVAQQVGGTLADGGQRGDEHVTVQHRGDQVDSAKYGRRRWPRTDHMVGTEHALQAILGLRAGADQEVTVQGGRVHVFETMAMANTTLCSKAGKGASGQGSKTMIASCSRHLRHTMELLQPNVVLAQGWAKTGPSSSASVANVLGISLPVRDSMTRAAASWGEVRFVAAYHPSMHWVSESSAAWRALEPALRAAGTP